MASKKKHTNPVEKTDNGLRRSLNTTSQNPKKNSLNFLQAKTLFPLFIGVISIFIAGLVVNNHQNHVSVLKAMILAENRLKMENTSEHIMEYLNGIYSDLLYISLDPDIKAMNKNSQEYIQSLFDLQWSRRRLSELYVIKRDFDGTHSPFLTFEYNNKTKSADEFHPIEDEAEEFQIHIEQIRHFTANPALRAQLSQEIDLCLKNPDGSFVRGLVYSLPVYSNETFAGIVAAMIPTKNIGAELERGNYNNMVILTNKRQDIYKCLDLPAATKNWFSDRFKTKGTEQFFAEAPEQFQVGKWTTIWSPVDILNEQQWWLAFQYDETAYQSRSGLYWLSNGYVTATGLLTAGFILALLVFNTNKRHEERMNYFRERKQAAKQIKNQNVILEKAVRDKQQDMELLTERLIRQEKLAAIGQISGSIAHELRNPLSAIKQSIFFLNRLRENDKLESSESLVNKHLKLLSREVDISNKVIADLLQTSKTGPIKKEQLNLQSAISEVLDQYPVQKNTLLNIDLKPEPFLIWADPQQFHQVITNLIGNATQAISKKGAIKISAKMSNRNKICSIDFQDNGSGIAPENLSKVFEPLYTSKSKGIGLGLSICKQIIENHGGSITMTSQIGKGTCVNIQLPSENHEDD